MGHSLMSDNVVCLDNTPIAARDWRPLGGFTDSLWRHLPPDMFLRAHRARDADDCLFRQSLFLVASLGSETPDQTPSHRVFRKLSGFTAGTPVETIVKVLDCSASLIELLKCCGMDPLEEEDYRYLASWSGWRGEEDRSRLKRLMEHQALTSDVIAVVARAPDDLYSLLAGRSSEDIEILLSVAPELVSALPLYPDDARSFLADRLSHVRKDGLADHIRNVLMDMRKTGAFRKPPAFSDRLFCTISRPAATVQHLVLAQSVHERILFEHAFLVGVRTDAGSPTFNAFLLLEAIYGPDRAPAGYLLDPVVLDADGNTADASLAAEVTDRLLKSARDPVFLRAQSGVPSGLERLVMVQHHCNEDWT
jgi:hypothetical protein